MPAIPFNKPFVTGKETEYIGEAVNSGKISGNGVFTKKCSALFEKKFNIKKALLTTSCTHALEMAAILMDIKTGDEVIAPSFTFVSTVNAFVLRGAKIIFADSGKNNPNMNEDAIEALITPRTKGIVPVHYAGIACNMDKIMSIAAKHNVTVVEDAAQAVDSYYKDQPLGSIGHLSAFSFHETKNITAGEGGLLGINDEAFIARAEIIRENGTNRSAFLRGEVDKYGWVDIGSSFLPSEIIAAYLYAQLQNIDLIQDKRRRLWQMYYELLLPLEKAGMIDLPFLPPYASNNAHMFYIVLKDANQRSRLINYLKEKEILTVFHYLSLHKSAYYAGHQAGELINADRFSDCLLRLPMFYELATEDIQRICYEIGLFLKKG